MRALVSAEHILFEYLGCDERIGPDGRVLGEYGDGANAVYAEFIWMSPEVGDTGLFGGDDGLGGYMPLSVVADDGNGAAQLSWVHGNHMGVPAVYRCQWLSNKIWSLTF